MSFPSAAQDSCNGIRSWTPKGISKLAFIALGATSLAMWAISAAAETPDGESDEAVVDEAVAPETASHRENAEGLRTTTARLGDDEILIIGEEPEQNCRNVRVTGTRLPQVVCTPVAQAAANDQRDEEQARDWLRRMQEQSTIQDLEPDGPGFSMHLPTGF